MVTQTPLATEAYASAADFEACRRLHRQFGSTYYFATLRFPREIRRKVHAVYGFVRMPDEWVDNGGPTSQVRKELLLEEYRRQFILGMDGVPPEHDVLRAFCDVCRECEMPIEEPLQFLDAMASDLEVGHYETYADLRAYMRGSAAAVGLMMCHVLELKLTANLRQAAIALGEAMQMTNFLRDAGEDYDRGRIYIPQEDLSSFGVSEADIAEHLVTESWRRLMRFEIARTRALYELADSGIAVLPRRIRKPVKLARILYSRILDRIERQDYDVFTVRARTTRIEKLACAAKVAISF